MLGPEERTGLRVLVSELGWIRALRVGVSVQISAARGAPFADLPPATDAKERGSREQAGPAALLFRALRRHVDDGEALRITGRAVEEGALTFLGRTLGRLDRKALDQMTAEEQEAWAKAKADAFPNATVEWKEVSRQQVVFEVTACRIVQLLGHAGHPELAPLFCAGDARYFGEVEPGTELVRPTTIAGGDDRCRFTIRDTGAERVIKVLHWTIILTLVVQALYCGFQVFVVLQPEGMQGPMLYQATDLPIELMVARRLYAIEGWIAFGILAIYLGITELQPRLHQGR